MWGEFHADGSLSRSLHRRKLCNHSCYAVAVLGLTFAVLLVVRPVAVVAVALAGQDAFAMPATRGSRSCTSLSFDGCK